MAERPKFMIVVANSDGDFRCVSSHVSEADAKKMAETLSGLIGFGTSVYLVPLPEAEGIIGSVIEPEGKPVAAEKAPAPLPMAPEAPQQPAKPPVPFRRLSQDAFLAETEAMLENDGWRDADAPLNDGGAIS